ncbi:unnamed protein product [Closterium sp. Yama58-4]|nr:unnamed protein product [Closterium sp. Yama58-4]
MVQARKASTQISELQTVSALGPVGKRFHGTGKRFRIVSNPLDGSEGSSHHPTPQKGDKDQLNNYRPITLLNFTYKVLARVLADRMKKFLGRVISPEQYGFLPGRRLTDAVGLVADIIDTARRDNEDWFLLLVDFKKAFDSVSRGYLFRTMRAMGFPDRFVKWVEGLHEGTQTRLLVNGWMGEGVEVVSGVRQGCPLAPYLFLCAVEPLAQTVLKRKMGISKANERLAYISYADDTTLILEGKQQIIRAE